ncbi:hypothetical protein TeGR_g7827 [Tetraparma gracilis]|uniref:Uncharacterized protein n=1 Tax=Tetraparma gracilis TaxID=2962635 RepID=A0ABQ6MRL4_9STRA|nr:hypothetical protein TeGR_g7827 [Tetraparma gracilis]
MHAHYDGTLLSITGDRDPRSPWLHELIVCVSSFSVAPSITSLPPTSFADSHISSLSPLLRSGVTSLNQSTFACTPLASLEGLPPSLLSVDRWCFSRCHLLPNLRGLPFSTAVSPLAFGAAHASACGDSRCMLLLAKATIELGFPSIDAWVQDRRLIPDRRRAVLLCVQRAREQEEEAAPANPVAPLLATLALIPDVLVREVIEFAYGDHL